MLRHVVNAHPELAIVNETQWLPRLFEHRHSQPGWTGNALVTNELLPALFALERFSRLDVDPTTVEPWLAAGSLPYVEFVGRLFDAHGRANDKRLVGEKSPGYVRHLPTLKALWPAARIVHLIRDGRDVYGSLAAWKPEKVARTIGRFSTWSAAPVITAALWWEWHVRLGLEGAAHLSRDGYYQLRYEDLVANPEVECQRMCDFLGLDYDEQMLKFHEAHSRTGPPPRRGPGLAVTAGLRDWRTDLGDDDQRHFEAAAGDLLDQLGYERAITDTREQDLAEVDAVRHQFAIEAKAHRHRVPEWPSMSAT
jgi:hypothetical protein